MFKTMNIHFKVSIIPALFGSSDMSVMFFAALQNFLVNGTRPDQGSLLVLIGHYWSIGGQLVD